MVLLGLLLLLSAAPSAAADTPFEATRLAMRTAGVEDGVPNPRVHTTFLDRHRRLWVGTQEGAAFLGGSGWTAFPLPAGAPSTYVRAIAETEDGALWFGTEAGGLWRHRHGQWRHWDERSGLQVSRVNALLAEGNTVWVGTGGGGLARVTGDEAERVAGPADPWVWALTMVRDRDGRPRLWVGGEKQVWFQQAEGWRRLGEDVGFWDAGANSIVVRRGPAGRREIWMSGWTTGVGRWDPERQRFEGPIGGLPSRSPTSLAAVPVAAGVDEIWVGTYDAGLVRYTGTGWEQLGTAQGFPSTGVYSLLANPDGRPALWVGTRGAGLVSVDPSGWRSLPALPELPSSQANCFLETTDAGGHRTFWIGTDRGLVRWDARGIRSETTAEGLPSDFISDIKRFDGPRGPELWVATLGGVARRRGERWETFPGWEALSLYRVNSLEADRLPDGRLRVYAGGDGGLAVLDDGRWRMIQGSALPPNAIVTSLLTTAGADGVPSLWVGMRGGGIARLKNGAWQALGMGDGLPNPSVYGLAQSQSPDGRRWLWAAMIGGGGLARLEVEHPERGFRTWNGDEVLGFAGRGVQRVAAGPGRDLYLTTSRGVVHLEFDGPQWLPVKATTFGTSDGLPSAASEAGAIYVDGDGRVWVGTAKGIAVLDPSQETPLPPPGPPVIEQVQVQGRVEDPDATVVMGYRDQRLRVSFGLPTFLRYEATLYRTQLLGLESSPQEWSRRAEREFTTLPAREYTLRIWALDGLGRETPPVDLHILVVPPWWQTWWAMTAAILTMAAVVMLLVRRHQRVLVARAHALEVTVAERTRELAVANEALHQQSLTDPLTGLGNRRSLQVQIDALTTRVIRRHRQSPEERGHENYDLGFLLLDMDRFKTVNDTLGHQAGDQVLQQAADLLRQTVREGDLVMRWGGEEFLVVAVNTEADELPVLAERIRQRIEAHPFTTSASGPVHNTASIGFTSMPLLTGHPDYLDWEQAVSLADQCLYRAKTSGRNRWLGLLPGGAPPAEATPPRPEVHLLIASNWVRLVKGPGR